MTRRTTPGQAHRITTEFLAIPAKEFVPDFPPLTLTEQAEENWGLMDIYDKPPQYFTLFKTVMGNYKDPQELRYQSTLVEKLLWAQLAEQELRDTHEFWLVSPKSVIAAEIERGIRKSLRDYRTSLQKCYTESRKRFRPGKQGRTASFNVFSIVAPCVLESLFPKHEFTPQERAKIQNRVYDFIIQNITSFGKSRPGSASDFRQTLRSSKSRLEREIRQGDQVEIFEYLFHLRNWCPPIDRILSTQVR